MHAMKVCKVVEVECQLLLTLSGCEWSASCPGRFTTRERMLRVHRPGGWVDYRANLDILENGKFPCCCW